MAGKKDLEGAAEKDLEPRVAALEKKVRELIAALVGTGHSLAPLEKEQS